ncbi:MAG: glycosyltransferase [Planctomycetota bacterium]
MSPSPANDRLSFVVFSDDWGRHPSSAQHLFRRISRDHRVLWVNTIGLRAAKADTFTLRRGLEKLREWAQPLQRIHENLTVLAPIMLPVSGDGRLASLNRRLTVWQVRRAMRQMALHEPVLFASIPTAIDYVGQLGESHVVYYVTDDYSLWPGGNADSIRRADRELTRSADLVLPCNQKLADDRRDLARRMVLLPHAVDAEHFRRPKSPEPDDLAQIPHPRVCFFGLLYEKIDLRALADLADARPEVQLVLIGPVTTDVSGLKGRANVHILGSRDYDQLPAYLHAMDAFVLPYILDEETTGKGPLKLRECFAVGLPTVARRIPALEQFSDLVELYDDPAQLPETIDQALNRGTPALKVAMAAEIEGQTWDARQLRLIQSIS